jgi:hypothetical protein
MRNKAQIIWYYRRKTVFLRQLKQVNMTNHDFWMSISDIINEGFTSEGLAKLDDYAEQFSTGKILYKRFSPSEQLGCVKGGTIHVIASLLAGAEVGANQLTAPEHSFKREQQLGKVQEKRIESWAKKTGCWVDDTSVYNQTLGDKLAQGGEAIVYDNGNSVLSDMHNENVFRGHDGVVYVIDCDIRINTPELKAGGTRTLTTEVEFIKE